jgi:hypothetical protein
MAEQSNTAILGKCQEFLTEQKRASSPDAPSKDMNTNLPNGIGIRFMQFCRGMKVGMHLDCYDVIGDQTGAIMVSKDNNGRTEVKEVAVGLLDRKEREKYNLGPVYNDKEEIKVKK